MDYEERYGESFYQPEWIQVDLTYMQNLEENLEYYKTFVRMIEEEVAILEERPEDSQEVIKSIKQYIEELEEVLH